MKRKLCLLLAVIMAAAVFCACREDKPAEPTEIDIPTTEPTAEPQLLDGALIDAYNGDWYGVYTVGEAAGLFVPNANVSNDCALRVSVDGYGRGVCNLTVNGMQRDNVSGSTNVFALCTALLDETGLQLSGMVNRLPIDWQFALEGELLVLRGRYGTDMDYMQICIALARPEGIFDTPLVLEAEQYLKERGFIGVVDLLGGSSAELPAVTAPEGYPTHVFFTEEEAEATPEPGDERSVMSADGHILVHLPEGYAVKANTVIDFIVACPEKGVESVDFTVSAWSTDSLSFLLGNTPNVTELYHYTIDGFDFYGTFLEGEPTLEGSAPTVFKLCGTDGSGMLIIINITLSMDAYSAYSYVNVDNADFTELILEAKVFADRG